MSDDPLEVYARCLPQPGDATFTLTVSFPMASAAEREDAISAARQTLARLHHLSPEPTLDPFLSMVEGVVLFLETIKRAEEALEPDARIEVAGMPPSYPRVEARLFRVAHGLPGGMAWRWNVRRRDALAPFAERRT